MLRKLFKILRVENNFNKMANLKFALLYFDVLGFLEVVWSHLGELFDKASNNSPYSSLGNC